MGELLEKFVVQLQRIRCRRKTKKVNNFLSVTVAKANKFQTITLKLVPENTKIPYIGG